MKNSLPVLAERVKKFSQFWRSLSGVPFWVLAKGSYRFDPDIEAYNEVSEFARRQETEAAAVRREALELETQDRLRKLLSVTQKEVVAILEMVPAGVILLDEYGNLLKCNALARDLLGISADAGPVNICEVLGVSQEETLRSEVAVEVEKDRPLSVISRPFQLEGSETGAVVTVQDISDRRALEAQTNKDREAFFSMIRHELKKPLLHVERFLESLEGSSGTELMRARSSASHLGDMVDDMLFLARMERDPMAVALADRVSLNFLLAGGDLAYRGRAKAAKVSLQMVPVEEEVFILGDEKRLNQVVANLLDNAIRFTPAGGHVALRGGTNGEKAWLEVEDCGSGVPQGHREKIFSAFYQVRTDDGRPGGLGLGLAICQRIVDAHNGCIEVGEGNMGGALIRVLLPIEGFCIQRR